MLRLPRQASSRLQTLTTAVGWGIEPPAPNPIFPVHREPSRAFLLWWFRQKSGREAVQALRQRAGHEKIIALTSAPKTGTRPKFPLYCYSSTRTRNVDGDPPTSCLELSRTGYHSRTGEYQTVFSNQ